MAACGNLHFREFSPFFFLPHVTSEPCSFAQLYICVSNYFFSSPYNKKTACFSLTGARTAGGVPSKIFPLMPLTCTSVCTSAWQLSRRLWFQWKRSANYKYSGCSGDTLQFLLCKCNLADFLLIFIIHCFSPNCTDDVWQLPFKAKRVPHRPTVYRCIDTLVQNNGHCCISNNDYMIYVTHAQIWWIKKAEVWSKLHFMLLKWTISSAPLALRDGC